MRERSSTSIALLASLLLSSVTLCLAQKTPEAGSVNGYITCSDTQVPARLARVYLFPLHQPETTPQTRPDEPLFHPAQTRTDGSFQINEVAPGDYYISVEYPGYLRPEYQFTTAEMRHPTAEARHKIVETVPVVTVAANKTSTINIALRRGGSISGTLRFEDGSPFPNADVGAIERTGASTDGTENGRSDDLGHFRIVGLSPGEYTLATGIASQDANAGTWRKGLTIFFGDGFFPKDAKTITLHEGEESSGNDITIRLSRIHSLTGVLHNVSGQIISAGEIELFAPGDKTSVVSATVEQDSAFHLDFVPEGQYLIRVTRAGDQSMQPAVRMNVSSPAPAQAERNGSEYSPYEAPLTVSTDMPDLTLTLPRKGK